MKHLITSLFIVLIHSSAVIGQNCYLVADNLVQGTVYRKSSIVIYKDLGAELRLETIREGDSYKMNVVYFQSIHEGVAINIMVNGKEHPLSFSLSNGTVVSLSPVEDKVRRSGNVSNGMIEYSNTYTLDKSGLNMLAAARTQSIMLRCYGTEVKKGVNNDDIMIPISELASKRFMDDIGCLRRPIDSMPAMGNETSSNVNKDAGINQSKSQTSPSKGGESKTGPSLNEPQNTALLTEIRDLLEEGATENKKEFIPRVFGFGVYFKTNYMYSDLIVPVNSDFDLVSARFLAGTSVNLTFNAGMRKKVGFRFEPNVDVLTNSASVQSGGTTSKASVTMIEAGLKLLLVVRRKRVNIYPGISGSYLNLATKQKVGSNSQSVERSGGSVGLILGGEYLVTPHIGVRLESGFLYYGLGKASGGGNSTESAFGSFARLGGSFYF